MEPDGQVKIMILTVGLKADNMNFEEANEFKYLGTLKNRNYPEQSFEVVELIKKFKTPNLQNYITNSSEYEFCHNKLKRKDEEFRQGLRDVSW